MKYVCVTNNTIKKDINYIMKQDKNPNVRIITAGSAYLDIDAYACAVAMAELLKLKGENAIAYSSAPCNYSVCSSLITEGQILTEFPPDISAEEAEYIVVDVSEPDFLMRSVPLDKVVEIYDHHVGFEEYWKNRIGDNSHIEFIGAAATLIYREWIKSGLQNKISRPTALLIIAAILDNTLNLKSSNTTQEDINVFNELCEKEKIGQDWCVAYFEQVQASVESDIKNALFNDMKIVRNNMILPAKVAQICVWDSKNILLDISKVREWFAEESDSWMINIIDIRQQCSYFICDNNYHQKEIEKVFDVRFKSGIARTDVLYLRKEIIKKTVF